MAARGAAAETASRLAITAFDEHSDATSALIGLATFAEGASLAQNAGGLEFGEFTRRISLLAARAAALRGGAPNAFFRISLRPDVPAAQGHGAAFSAEAVESGLRLLEALVEGAERQPNGGLPAAVDARLTALAWGLAASAGAAATAAGGFRVLPPRLPAPGDGSDEGCRRRVHLRGVLPLLALPRDVLAYVLSFVPAIGLAPLATASAECRSVHAPAAAAERARRLGERFSLPAARWEGEPLLRRLRFVDGVAERPERRLAAGVFSTLCVRADGVALAVGGHEAVLGDDEGGAGGGGGGTGGGGMGGAGGGGVAESSQPCAAHLGVGLLTSMAPIRDPTPLVIEGSPPVSSVAAGWIHSLVVARGGGVYSCGRGGPHGALGQGHAEHVGCPRRVGGPLAARRVLSVAAGSGHSLAIADDGGLFSWGSLAGVLGHGGGGGETSPRRVAAFDGAEGARIVDCAAGSTHSLALSDTGALYAWGQDHFGQCGCGEECPPEELLRPRRCPFPAGVSIAFCSAGDAHSLAVSREGALYSWGDGAHGKLGHGDETMRFVPTRVEALCSERVVECSAGDEHSVVLLDVGSGGGNGGGGGGGGSWRRADESAVASFGDNSMGQLGQPPSHELGADGYTLAEELLPRRVESLKGRAVAEVTAGGMHTVLRLASGQVVAFGFDGFGQVGGVGKLVIR